MGGVKGVSSESEENTERERERESTIDDEGQREERREATRLYLPMLRSGPRSTGGTAKEAITGLSRWKTLVKVRANERIRRSLRSDETRAAKNVGSRRGGGGGGRRGTGTRRRRKGGE